MSGQSLLVLAICTRQRPESLTRLLSFLAGQDSTQGWRILVVDNDEATSAKAVVDSARRKSVVPLSYKAEPKPGFATVRNAALKAAGDASAVCFLDDDAVVPPNWIAVMRQAHERSPLAIVRSRYIHLAEIPDTPADAADAIGGLETLHHYYPAGTSGLLLPIHVLGQRSFDPYYDQSGGEDLDLLLRLERSGIQTVVVDALVFEEQRVSSIPAPDQLRLARWNGALSTVIRTRVGEPTALARLTAAVEALMAAAKVAVAKILGKEEAAITYSCLAAGRWAAAMAPLRIPDHLGPRPIA